MSGSNTNDATAELLRRLLAATQEQTRQMAEQNRYNAQVMDRLNRFEAGRNQAPNASQDAGGPAPGRGNGNGQPLGQGSVFDSEVIPSGVRPSGFHADEVRFFDPQLPASYIGDDTVSVSNNVHYRSVHLFTEKRRAVASKGHEQFSNLSYHLA